MLGKTNIKTLKEGGIVTDVTDFSWVSMQSGVHTDFVRCIYENGYLAAIAPDGTIVWTTDGEVWNNVKLEYEDCWLNDIDWDGERFILAGSCKETISGKVVTSRMIFFTKDFESFEKLDSFKKENSEAYCIFPKNRNYIVITAEESIGSAIERMYTSTVDWTGQTKKRTSMTTADARNGYFRCNAYFAKNSDGILAHFRGFAPEYLYKVNDSHEGIVQ